MKNRKIVRTPVAIALLSLAALVLRPGVAPASEINQAESTKLAPGWELPGLDGDTLRSANFKGKVVVLDFWATWCPPCRAEIPDFIALQKKYAAQGLAVVGVSVDSSSLKTVKAFAQEMGINYPVLLADDKTVAAFGGIEVLPTTFIIDRTGRIVKQHLGYTAPTVVEDEIKKLLGP